VAAKRRPRTEARDRRRDDHSGDLTSPGPLQKPKLNLTEVSCPHGESRAEAGEWNDDDFDVLADGVVVGRIFKANAAPVGAPWIWTLVSRKSRGALRRWSTRKTATQRHASRLWLLSQARPRGIVKRLGSPYVSGRSLHWVKSKNAPGSETEEDRGKRWR
jgi:hypothetical protein